MHVSTKLDSLRCTTIIILLSSWQISDTALLQVRPVKADDIWLSPDYRRASCHITLTVYNPTPDTARTYFRRFFESTEKNLSLAPRIHWGKYVIGVGRSEVESMYPRLTDFARIRQQMDPHGIFINQPLRELFAFEK